MYDAKSIDWKIWQTKSFANRSKFKWNQQTKWKINKLISFQFMHTLAYFNEINAWIHKINMPITHQTIFFMSNMPSSVLSLLNLSPANGFVNKSANWFSVLTNWISQSLFWTWSRMKWCLISIWFVLKCCIGFLVKLMALVLSQYKGTLLSFTP